MTLDHPPNHRPRNDRPPDHRLTALLVSLACAAAIGCSESDPVYDEGASTHQQPEVPPSPTVSAQEIEALLAANTFADADIEERYRCFLNQYLTEAGSRRLGDPVVEETSQSLTLGWCDPLDSVPNDYCLYRSEQITPPGPGANNSFLFAGKNVNLDPAPISTVGVTLEHYPENTTSGWAMRYSMGFRAADRFAPEGAEGYGLFYSNNVISTQDYPEYLDLGQPYTVDTSADFGAGNSALLRIALESDLAAREQVEQMLQSSEAFTELSLNRTRALQTQAEQYITSGQAQIEVCGASSSGGCGTSPLPADKQEEALQGVRTELARRIDLIQTYGTELHRLLADKVTIDQCWLPDN